MASPSRSLQRLQHRFRATARSYTEGPDVKAVDKTRVRHNARSRAEVALARAEKPFAALTTTEKGMLSSTCGLGGHDFSLRSLT